VYYPAMKRAPDKALPSQARLLELLHYDCDLGHLFWKERPNTASWNATYAGTRAGSRCPRGYREIAIDNRTYLEHRLIWKLVTGKDPVCQIDHINLDKGDNRFANLREADFSTNQRNTRARAQSGLKGAHWNRFRGYWQSALRMRGKTINLGRFETAEEAHAAYCEAAKRYYGEFVRTG
jgi:hypothetical protein